MRGEYYVRAFEQANARMQSDSDSTVDCQSIINCQSSIQNLISSIESSKHAWPAASSSFYYGYFSSQDIRLIGSAIFNFPALTFTQ